MESTNQNLVPWHEVQGEVIPERAERIEQAKQAALNHELTYNLKELRNQRDITQVELAKRTGRNQSAISTMEASSDYLLSTLRQTVEAMGGTLQLNVIFNDETVTPTP